MKRPKIVAGVESVDLFVDHPRVPPNPKIINGVKGKAALIRETYTPYLYLSPLKRKHSRGKLPCYQDIRGYKRVVDKKVDKKVALMFSITYEKAPDSSGSGRLEPPTSRATLILTVLFPRPLLCPVRPLPARSPAPGCRFRGAPGPGSPAAIGFRYRSKNPATRAPQRRWKQSSGSRRKRPPRKHWILGQGDDR